MPYLYYFDEEHIGEWLELARTAEGAQTYFDRYVFGVENFGEIWSSSAATPDWSTSSGSSSFRHR